MTHNHIIEEIQPNHNKQSSASTALHPYCNGDSRERPQETEANGRTDREDGLAGARTHEELVDVEADVNGDDAAAVRQGRPEAEVEPASRRRPGSRSDRRLTNGGRRAGRRERACGGGLRTVPKPGLRELEAGEQPVRGWRRGWSRARAAVPRAWGVCQGKS